MNLCVEPLEYDQAVQDLNCKQIGWTFHKGERRATFFTNLSSSKVKTIHIKIEKQTGTTSNDKGEKETNKQLHFFNISPMERHS